MIFLWWIQLFLSFLSAFLPQFLSILLLTLFSLGAYWHFPANLLLYAHLNVCCLIRCAGGLEFHSTSLPTLFLSSRLFIPPSCALKVKLPFTKTPAVLSGRPHDPIVIAAASRREKRPHLPWEEDNGTKVCVCVCVWVRAVYLLPHCLNTCDSIQSTVLQGQCWCCSARMKLAKSHATNNYFQYWLIQWLIFLFIVLKMLVQNSPKPN